jgi:hypothetical protein
MEDYANHRNQRNQIFEDRYGKIENRNPQHPALGGLNGLLKDTARTHRDSVRGGGGADRGVPNNSADLGFDRRGRDAYDDMGKNPGSYKIVDNFSPKIRPPRDDE